MAKPRSLEEAFDFLVEGTTTARQLIIERKDAAELVVLLVQILALVEPLTRCAIKTYESIYQVPVNQLLAEKELSAQAQAYINPDDGESSDS